jgi:hypothetical protein
VFFIVFLFRPRIQTLQTALSGKKMISHHAGGCRVALIACAVSLLLEHAGGCCENNR